MKEIIFVTLMALLLGIFFIKPTPVTNLPASRPTAAPRTGLPSSPSMYARNLGGVRDLVFSPGGILLASVTSAGTIIALPDGNMQTVLSGLNKPHGMAFYADKLYVAEETRIARYDWNEPELTAVFDKELFTLPPGGNHYTRSIVFDDNGKLYISVGSTCNVCTEKHPWYASIIVSDNEGNNPQVIASGLRNSVFMTKNPVTGEIWATEMGRDYLGDDRPSDEINIIRAGNYGWPKCYGNRIADTTIDNGQLTSDICQYTIPPIYEIPAHSAPLGLAFNGPSELYVAYHGSWNRTEPIGYKVVRMKVEGDKIVSEEDVITGIRPVDIIFDTEGNMYVSDDREGVIYSN